MPQMQGQNRGRGSGSVAPVTSTKPVAAAAAAAATSFGTQTWLDRRKSASDALDLEAVRSDEQLQCCTDHCRTEAATASDVSQRDHTRRTGIPT